MRPQLHLARDVAYGSIGMGCGVVEELKDAALYVGEGCGGVRGGYGADAGEHRVIYGASVVKKNADDLLDPCLLRGRQLC